MNTPINHLTAGFIGLGLIGGSIARGLKRSAPDIQIMAYMRTREKLEQAHADGVVDLILDGVDEHLSECDIIFLCTPVEFNESYLRQIRPFLKEDAIVTDVGSTKTSIHETVAALGMESCFVGGHPMAGTQFSGFKYAKADLYHGAPMVLVPPRFDDIELLGRVKDLLTPAGFGSYSVTTAEQHDEMIAFTSQLAHVASNAYIKSPTAKKHKGFSAGSYKDMTRVAWLAPRMWAELFLENRDFLLKEIDCYIEHLSQYKAAMEQNDEEELIRLLDEGKKRKEEVDG